MEGEEEWHKLRDDHLDEEVYFQARRKERIQEGENRGKQGRIEPMKFRSPVTFSHY